MSHKKSEGLAPPTPSFFEFFRMTELSGYAFMANLMRIFNLIGVLDMLLVVKD